MKQFKPAFILAIALAIGCGAAEARYASKVELQALTRSEIQKISTNGQLTFVDLSSSTIRKLTQTDNHPEIFANTSGTLYVLCITAADSKGKKVPIDIYISKYNNTLKLVDIIYGDAARTGFMKLVQKGIVRRI